MTATPRSGRQSRSAAEEGNTFTTTYDDLNRVKTSTGPAASGSSAQQTVSHAYGLGGSWETITDALGEKTTTLFDAMQRPTLQMVNAANGTNVSSTGYWYSPDYQSVTTTDYTNVAGQKVLTRHADGSFQRWVYDANGNQTSAIDEQGQVTSATYDALNRVATQTLPAATPGGGAVTSFVYDAMGNLLQRPADLP